MSKTPLHNSSKLVNNIINQIQNEKGQAFIDKHRKEVADKMSTTRATFSKLEVEDNWES